jgi:hypothetical protein
MEEAKSKRMESSFKKTSKYSLIIRYSIPIYSKQLLGGQLI